MTMRPSDSGAQMVPPRIDGRCHGKSQFAAVSFLTHYGGQLTAAEAAQLLGGIPVAKVRYLADHFKIPLKRASAKEIITDPALRRWLSKADRPKADVVVDDADYYLGAAMSIAALERDGFPREFGCRWIDSDVKADPHWNFCGQKRASALTSYCEEHHKRVIKPATQQEQSDDEASELGPIDNGQRPAQQAVSRPARPGKRQGRRGHGAREQVQGI